MNYRQHIQSLGDKYRVKVEDSFDGDINLVLPSSSLPKEMRKELLSYKYRIFKYDDDNTRHIHCAPRYDLRVSTRGWDRLVPGTTSVDGVCRTLDLGFGLDLDSAKALVDTKGDRIKYV